MGLPRVDTSVWNLGLPLALVGGCSRIYAIDDDGAASESTTVVAETTAPSTSVGPDPTLGDTTTTSPTTIDPSQTDPTIGDCSFDQCQPGYCCVEQQCVFFGCPPECPQEQCCYGMCGAYGCYSDDECGGGAVCSYGACLPIDLEPECMLTMQLEFQIPIIVPFGDIRALAFVDADGDAQHDVVIGEGTRVRLLTAADQSLGDLQVGVEAASVIVGDLDADGDDDIVFGDRIADGPAVRALLHDPMVSFTPVWLADLPATTGLALADSDGDMVVDVLAIDELTGLNWLRGLGGATFEPALPIFDAATSVAVGAIDGDIFPDIVAHQGFEWALVGPMFEPNQLLEHDYGAPTRVVAVGDFDGAGVDDVVALQSSVGTTIVTSWQGSVFDFVEHKSWWFGATTMAARADIDDDGYDDVVTAGGEYQFVVGHGAPPMATSDVLDCVLTVPTQLPVLQLAVGDFTGDGRLDVVTSNGSNLDVYVQTS